VIDQEGILQGVTNMRDFLLAMSDAALSTIPILMKNMGLDPAQSSSLMFNNINECHWYFRAFPGVAVVFHNKLL